MMAEEERIKQQIPEFRLDVPFSVPYSAILEVFTHTARAKGFQLIEQSEGLVTAIARPRLTFREWIHCCIRDSNAPIAAVRLQVRVSERKCKRTVLLKGVSGRTDVVMRFIKAFQGKISAVMVQAKYGRSPSDKSARSYEPLEEDVASARIEPVSYYYLHKILASEAYSLGKSLARFFVEFAGRLHTLSASAATEEVKKRVDLSVQILCSHFNLGKSGSEPLILLSRPAAERFIFTHIGPPLLSLYTELEREIDAGFHEKQAILSLLTTEAVWNLLEVSGK